MQKLSLIAVLTAFFACGTALGAHARDTEKTARQGQVSIGISDGTKPWHEDFNVLSVSSVPVLKIAEGELALKYTLATYNPFFYPPVVF